MFDILLNHNIEQHLKEVKCSDNESEIQLYLDQNYIPINALLETLKQPQYKTDEYMKELLTPLNFKFKEKRVLGSQYTKAFKTQLEYLKLQQEELEYQEMIKSTASATKDKDELTPSQMHKQVKEQVTTIFNILLSVFSVIAAIWYWTSTSMRLATEFRVLMCLFFGILVLVAEVVVYNSYLRKIDEAKSTERSKIEERKVVKKIIF